LSEQGKTRKNIVVPSEINGLPVKFLSDEFLYGEHGDFTSDVLERVYLTHPVMFGSSFRFEGKNLKKILMINPYSDPYGILQEVEFTVLDPNGAWTNWSIPSELVKVTADRCVYLEENYRYICYSWRLFTKYIINETFVINYLFRSVPANVTYDYNYAESKNDGVYWIDDYEYGEQITFVPPGPEREGYTFGGWYKDAECTQAWDFAVDKLPTEKRTEDGYLIYQETVLYAQWI
jgi:uncharacterized repeat protein (TIGR02543 family)